MANIAYIVLCHDQPELLLRLSDVLAYADDHLFVHVDKKVDISPFKQLLNHRPNVTFIDSRIENFWGGFNSIRATMETMRAALGDPRGFDRLVILQGKDYPLHSPRYIHQFFDSHSGEEFCRAKNISESADPHDYMKVCGYWSNDNCNTPFGQLRRHFFNFINSRLKVKYRPNTFIHKQIWEGAYHGRSIKAGPTLPLPATVRAIS